MSSRIIRHALLVVAMPFAMAKAQQSVSVGPPSSQPEVSDSAIKITLLTMGQGSQVYELFGHNAIWVHDPSRSFDIVYNWGVFDFRTPGFLGRFLLGDMRYMMAGETLENTLRHYAYLNRQVWAQELNLTPAEKRQLVDYIRWNALPENAQYRYDYYLDNCSTRVRDAIDRVLGGQLRAYLRAIPTEESYRSHSLRLMQGDKLMVTGVEMALGRPTDVKVTADQASFLPVQLMQYVRGLKLDGGTRPLVAREYVMNEATRAPEAESLPAMWKALVPIGLLLGGLVFFLAVKLKSRRGLATMIAMLAGLFGLIGLIITLLVTITDHVAAHGNENMFMLNPLWLILAVAGPMLVLRGRAAGVARWTSIAAAGLALCAVAIHLFGMSRQPNWDVIGLLLPSQLAIAMVLIQAAGLRSPRSVPDARPGA